MPVDPSIYDDVQRDGLATITKLAKQICTANASFGYILRLKFRATPEIQLLLDTLDAVCGLLPQAQASLIVGGNNDAPSADPTTIPGIDVSAPIWVEDVEP